MAITLPAQTTAYQSPINSLPARWDRADQSYVPPPEGSRFVPFEIDWTAYPVGGAVACNVYGNQPNAQLSRIVALSVDNVDCGSDVQFVFPDTAEVLTVPAYASGIFPVFTGAVAFYVIAPNAVSSDVTRFKVHNTLPPPVALEKTEFQDAVAVSAISLSTAATTNVVGNTISGTLEAISIGMGSGENAGSSGAQALVVLQDGSGANIWAGILGYTNNGICVSYNLSALKVRFRNGINFIVTSTNITSGSASVALYYQVP